MIGVKAAARASGEGAPVGFSYMLRSCSLIARASVWPSTFRLRDIGCTLGLSMPGLKRIGEPRRALLSSSVSLLFGLMPMKPFSPPMKDLILSVIVPQLNAASAVRAATKAKMRPPAPTSGARATASAPSPANASAPKKPATASSAILTPSGCSPANLPIEPSPLVIAARALMTGPPGAMSGSPRTSLRLFHCSFIAFMTVG